MNILTEEEIEEDAIQEEVNEDFPPMKLNEEEAEELALLLSSRINSKKQEEKHKGQRDVYDGEIHEIVNNYLFGLSPSELKSGFSCLSSDGVNVQIQVKSAYSKLKSSLKIKDKKFTETNDKILRLAEIFGLRKANRNAEGKVTEVVEDSINQGRYNFPEDTFEYRSTLTVDPTLVHESQFEEFKKDMVAIGKKYTQRDPETEKPILPSPIKEEQTCIPTNTFHKSRLKLGHAINEKIAQIFQNLSITIPKPKKGK